MDSGRLFFNPSCNGNMLFLGSGDPVFRGSRSVMNMEETLKRRPFFSSPEELCDEEYYEDQLPEKKRRLTPEQVHWLEKSFETENKLEPEQKTELAKKLGLQPRQVAVWFQNRRARWKTKTLERNYDQLKSSYDSLQSNYDALVKENEKFKAEVLSLTEKLQTKKVAEEPGLGEKSEPTAADPLKVEDRLSTGSGESAVVDEDGRQVVDSGDSYFPNDDDYPGYVTPVDGGVGSEEDNGQKYFPTVFDEAEEQNNVEGESRSWCIWY